MKIRTAKNMPKYKGWAYDPDINLYIRATDGLAGSPTYMSLTFPKQKEG